MQQPFFDPGRHRWREATGGSELSCKVRHDYTILGHDSRGPHEVRRAADWQAHG